MQIIPLNPVPSQTLTVVLNTQECVIHVYQRSTGVFLDLGIAGTLVLAGVICHDRSLLVLDSYIGLLGDLVFVDTLGTSDPAYSGLGTRWLLAFLLPIETISPATVVPFWVPVPTATPTLTPIPTGTVIVTASPTPTPTPTGTGTGTPTPTPTPTSTSTAPPSLPGAPTGVTIT